MRAVLPALLTSTVFAACGSDPAATFDAPPAFDSAPVIDAAPPPPDAVVLETCDGFALPTTATDPVTISGTTNELSLGGLTPVGGIALTAYSAADVALDTTTSSVTVGTVGEFSLTAASGGVPVDGYVEATGDGFVDVYIYPPNPITDSQADLPGLMVSPDTFGFLNSLLLGEAQEAANAWIGVVVLDDAGDPVAGATVGSVPGASLVRYNSTGENGTLPDVDAVVTDADGVAYLINVPAGDVTVYASKAGLQLRPNTLEARAGVITMTAVPTCANGTVLPTAQ